jgi:hypothetical protein
MAPRPRFSARRLSIILCTTVALTPAARSQPMLNSDPSAASVRAPLLTYGVDAGVGETDNINLVSMRKVSQTIATADADFSLNEQSRLLTAKATGDFSYLDYLQNAYSSQVLGRFDGTANFALVPERLVWVVNDDFGETAVDAYTATTPNNIQYLNFLSTGPDLFTRIGAVNFINLSARYARAQYETSPFNSNRLLSSIELGHDISAGAAVSLNGQLDRVMFENTLLNSDFTRSSGFGRYDLQGARMDFEADLGGTVIRQAGGSHSGALAKVQLSRKLSPAAKLTATAGRELTDASSSFASLQSAGVGLVGGGVIGGGAGIVATAPAPQTSDSYTSNYLSLGWQYLRNRTTLAANARWEKDSYAGARLFDVTRAGVDLSIRRRLTRSFTAELQGRWYKTDYPYELIGTQTESSNFDDWLAGGSLAWRHGRGLEIRLRFDHQAHVVTAGSSGYGENRVFLTVGYRPAPASDGAEPVT